MRHGARQRKTPQYYPFPFSLLLIDETGGGGAGSQQNHTPRYASRRLRASHKPADRTSKLRSGTGQNFNKDEGKVEA